MEMTCMMIISNVGMARSCYIEAIDKAEEGKIEEAQALVEEGNKYYVEGHHTHLGMIQQEAAGEDVKVCMLLIHAEDQLMSAETFQILAEKFINLAKHNK